MTAPAPVPPLLSPAAWGFIRHAATGLLVLTIARFVRDANALAAFSAAIGQGLVLLSSYIDAHHREWNLRRALRWVQDRLS